jgi:hypothetical protein
MRILHAMNVGYADAPNRQPKEPFNSLNRRSPPEFDRSVGFTLPTDSTSATIRYAKMFSR